MPWRCGVSIAPEWQQKIQHRSAVANRTPKNQLQRRRIFARLASITEKRRWSCDPPQAVRWREVEPVAGDGFGTGSCHHEIKFLIDY